MVSKSTGVAAMLTVALFLGWCVTITYAHQIDPDRDVWRRPISLFRDGQIPQMGWVMFAILISIVLSHGFASRSRKEVFTPIVCLTMAVGLAIVAMTKSASKPHDLAALGVMLGGYLYFTVCLYREALEWNDPLLRAVQDQKPAASRVSADDLQRGKLWFAVFKIHQGCVALSVLILPWLSPGLAQKVLVTHLLLMMVLHETLPRRRIAPKQYRSRKRRMVRKLIPPP